MEENSTYTPTKKEELLLEALLNPANRHKNVVELCGIVPCDTKTYYAAFKKPEFQALYKSLAMELVKNAVGPVVNTFIREATRGSFQHGKVVLEMADMYQEKNRTEHTGNKGGPITLKVVYDDGKAQGDNDPPAEATP